MALALALVAVAIATGQWAWVIPALVVGVLAGAALLGGATQLLDSNLPAGLAAKDPTRPHIGMGADIAADAVVEPGATVEMGATIGPRVVIKRGAVVRMGATVLDGAVLEEGAMVSWGADVRGGAVIGSGAIVGAGATVSDGARVPAGMHLMPGTTWKTSATGPRDGGSPSAAAPEQAVARDPRIARIDAVCDRLEAELRGSSAQLREALGVSDQTVATLRRTCHGVLARERTLRGEAAPETLALLGQEKAELERRIAAATDEAVRRSLRSAVGAIEDQQRQRELFRKSADRLDAELTRLQWTLDGMGTQLVRLRSAGLEAATTETGVVGTLNQLYSEIDALAEGLEEVARMDREERAFEPIADVSGDPAPLGRDGARERD
jgi:carbonic anhydrase/acetyltransferase-like protein (isoleucine patch superfamily)